MACLSFDALSDPFAFLLRGTTPAIFSFLLLLCGNKIVEWIWTFHFFVFGLSTLILYSATSCVCVYTFWKITGAFFLTLADLYFAVKCCKTVDKNCLQFVATAIFWEDFSVKPHFVKALLYWPFWYMPVAVTIWIIKPVVDKCLSFTPVNNHVDTGKLWNQ